jgi:hypothetical protein
MIKKPYKYEQVMSPAAVYFCLPEKGIAVSLHPGDILYFNPQHYHCLSQPTREYQNEHVYVTLFLYENNAIGW